MADEQRKPETGKPPQWVEAVGIFGDITAWIAAPIVLALLLGKYLDGRYGTEPIWFLSLAGFGFLVTCYGIMKVIREYLRKHNK